MLTILLDRFSIIVNDKVIIVDGFVIAAAALLTKAGTGQKPGPGKSRDHNPVPRSKVGNRTTCPKDNSPQDNSPHENLALKQLAPDSEDNLPHFVI